MITLGAEVICSYIIDKTLLFDGLSIGHGNLVCQGEKGGKRRQNWEVEPRIAGRICQEYSCLRIFYSRPFF